jgi:hypothetical protein
MGVLTITRIPPKGGNKQEMVAPVLQGSGVNLLGDGSSHHYKDPPQKGEISKRWLCLYIKDLGLISWEMGVLIITRIFSKGGKKQ